MQTERSSQGFGNRYRQIPFMYDVKRSVYNEENFQQEHRRKGPTSGNMDINITTFKHHVQCRCSWHKFLRCMLTVFPFLEWMCLYRFKDWLLGDLLAGLSVGLVQVPQGLTLSLLTRQLIPPLNVAYAAFCSSVIYVIFGSCHQMSIGPFFLVSALMINVLKERPFNNGHLIMGTFVKDDFSVPTFYLNYNRSLSMVASTTFLTGIIQLSMGMLGMGFVATYLPEAATSAYLAAVALHIILAQMTCIFGIMVSFHAGPIAFIYNIINYCIALPKANSTSILLFLTAVVALRVNKCIRISFNRYPIEFPMELLLILGFSMLTSRITMATENSKMLINMIPYSELLSAHISGQEDCQLAQLQNQFQPGFNSHWPVQLGQLLLQMLCVYGRDGQDYYPGQVWRKTAEKTGMLLSKQTATAADRDQRVPDAFSSTSSISSVCLSGGRRGDAAADGEDRELLRQPAERCAGRDHSKQCGALPGNHLQLTHPVEAGPV
nr:testis anion transporter 1 isoform X10 [Rattus norvegicus]